MSTTTAPDQDLGFPEGSSGYDGPLEGMYPATLVRMEKAQRSELPNKFGKTPLTSKFVFVIDGYEHELWAFPNVEARGELSTFHKIFKALTGQPLTAATPMGAIYGLIGKRCSLIIEESTARPGFPRISDFKRIPPARPAAPRPAPQPSLEEEFSDVPF
jgi:hypothetical protein